MPVDYSVTKLVPTLSTNKVPKFYARAQVRDNIDIKAFAESISSQTTLSRADVTAVLISTVENLIRELKRGNQICLGDLGKFRLQINSVGADSADKFNAASNIKGVNIQFVPGDDLKGIFTNMEFEQVASRVAQKAAAKAEKDGKNTVDLAEAKAKAKAKGKKENGGSEHGGEPAGGTTQGSGSEESGEKGGSEV